VQSNLLPAILNFVWSSRFFDTRLCLDVCAERRSKHAVNVVFVPTRKKVPCWESSVALLAQGNPSRTRVPGTLPPCSQS